MRKTEIQHNSYEQVRQYLIDALDVVSGLEIEDDLRPIAFTKAVDLFAAKQVFFEQPAVLPDGLLRRPN